MGAAGFLAVQQFLWGGLMGALIGGADLRTDEVASPSFPKEAFPFATQLNTWGWSQPLTEGTAPPAMQWRAAQAAAQGVEVMWWTDQLGLLDQSEDLVIPLAQGQLDPATLNVVRMPGGLDAVTVLEAQVQGGKAESRLRNGWLEMSLTSDLETAAFQSFSYRPRSAAGKPQGFRFARPLASQPQWQMEVEAPQWTPVYASRSPFPAKRGETPGGREKEKPEEAGAAGRGNDVAFEIDVELSAHGEEIPSLHRLTYLLVPSGAEEDPWVEEEAHVFIPVPLTSGVNVLTLDWAADAQRLPDGEDNVISDVAVTVRARRGATASLRWRRPRLVSQRPGTEELLAAIRDHALRYERDYEVTQWVSGMYSRDYPPSLSAFLPPSRTVEPFFLGKPVSSPPANWVTDVHAARGLVAYHLGGVPGRRENGKWRMENGNSPPVSPRISSFQPPISNFPFPPIPPEQRTEVLSLATTLLETRAYGADLFAFEATAQGGLELSAQLAVWDIALANDLRMGGVGVSWPAGVVVPGDLEEPGSRGNGKWKMENGKWKMENGERTFSQRDASHFQLPTSNLQSPISSYLSHLPTPSEPALISWLWARDRTAPELLAALRDRRVFFGDPERWEGPFDLRLTDRFERKEYGRMGQEMKVPAAEAFLHLDLELSPGVAVLIIQGLLRPGRSVHYVRREAVADPVQAVMLETQQACFVRVEVWDEVGPLVCSNPLIIRKPRR